MLRPQMDQFIFLASSNKEYKENFVKIIYWGKILPKDFFENVSKMLFLRTATILYNMRRKNYSTRKII